MDDALSRLERAHAGDPDDPTIRVELARAYVRVGRPARALAVLGSLDEGEREAAGRALAAALGLLWTGITDGTDRFRVGERGLDVLLVPGGVFLDDGDSFLVSSLLERQSRADLRRVQVPAFLASVRVFTSDAFELGTLADSQRLEAGRLPTRHEWKKLWRGGLFLDGDASARTTNPEPDRTGPGASTVYGAWFEHTACEVLQGHVGGQFDWDTGRYFVSLATPEQRRGRRLVRRLVRDVPRALT